MSFKKNIIRIQSKHNFFKYISLLGIAGLVLGIIGGYMYYYFIGCQSGSCPITSNPWASIGWGAVLGYLLGDSIISSKKKEEDQKKEEL